MHFKYIKTNNLELINQVNKSSHAVPEYDITKKKIHPEFYLSASREVVMIGRIDANYINWLSFSSLDDKELNAKIFNSIINERHPYVSQSAKVLGKRYYEVKGWLKGEIRHTSVGGMLWNTPFGHYYGMGNVEEHGRHFANDLTNYFDSQLQLCDMRMANGDYEKILYQYLELLQKKDVDYMYYEQLKPLIHIIENEAYLVLSPNEEVKELYLQCLREINRLYNAYMTIVK
ncbi:MAG: hypothetical protein Q4G58_02945 [bacterium]|nr:hypothetical protein [bacterium]